MKSSLSKNGSPIACELAIVGISCRFPGGGISPELFWNNLELGQTGISKIPPDRWDASQFYHPTPGIPGRYYVDKAGTLGEVAGFDAGFFGISPREASQMDPQQRLLMELTWEAFENGGIVPQNIAGSNCSVHIGISSADYANLRLNDPASFDGYSMLGSTLSIAANRISHFFDLRGSSMAVDSACSSALVALNEAVHALLDGRAEMALVGGVNLLLSPHFFVGFSRAAMLSEYGECRSFANGAKGYVRAEGGGVMLIKPLANALRDGDRVHAVIRGSGSNNDGHTPGIAVPSASQQADLLTKVYDRFGLDPNDLVYLEAHGTGTSVGDPIEADAIGRALGGQRKTPLPIGSVKSNIGHLEPASGIAGIMKAIGILHRKIIPCSRLVGGLNDEIPFDTLNIRVVRENESFSRGTGPALIGVNSFGFGGTNAHIVLQEFVTSDKSTKESGDHHLVRLPLSARSEPALRVLSQQMANYLEDTTTPLIDVAYTAAFCRTHHSHRLTLQSRNRETMIQALRNFTDRQSSDLINDGVTISHNPKVAFVFAGNGAQGTDEGLKKMIQDPLLKVEIESVDALAREIGGWSFLDQFYRPVSEREFSSMVIIQPLCFAIQTGLAKALMSEGLVPSAVMGHSFGELAAASCSGIISQHDAIQVILSRTSIQELTHGQGCMAAASIGEKEALELIAPFEESIEIAAVNSPNAVTFSGTKEVLSKLEGIIAARGTDFRFLGLDYPFHSRQLDFGQQRMLDDLKQLKPSEGMVPFYSSVTGAKISHQKIDAHYWWRNVRQPVRFDQAMASLLADDHAIFIEIGAYPIMQAYMRHAIKAASRPGKPLSVMSRLFPSSIHQRIGETVERAYVIGAKIDWKATLPAAGKLVDLPYYPWERKRHWFPVTEEAHGMTAIHSEGILLGSRFNQDSSVWENLLDTAVFPMFSGHRYRGDSIFPGSGFLEIALEAASTNHASGRLEIRFLQVFRPLLLSESKSRKLKTSIESETGLLRIWSKNWLAKDGYILHASGKIGEGGQSSIPPLPPLHEVIGRKRRITKEEHYATMERVGMGYDAKFLSVDHITLCHRYAEARLIDPTEAGYLIHPAVLDGAFQSFGDLLQYDDVEEPLAAVLPVQIDRLVLYQPSVTVTSCRIFLVSRTKRSSVADIDLLAADGSIVSSLRRVRFVRVADEPKQMLGTYRLNFVPLELDDDENVLGDLSEVSKNPEEQSATDLNLVFSGYTSFEKSLPWSEWIRAYPAYTSELIAAGGASLPEALTLTERKELALGSFSSSLLDQEVIRLVNEATNSKSPRRKAKVLHVSVSGCHSFHYEKDHLAFVNVEFTGDVSLEGGIVPHLPELLPQEQQSQGFDLIVLRHPLLYGYALEQILQDSASLLQPWGQILIASFSAGSWSERVFERVDIQKEVDWFAELSSAHFSNINLQEIGSGIVLSASISSTQKLKKREEADQNLRQWLLVAGESEEEMMLAQELAILLLDRGHYVSIFTNHCDFVQDEVGVSFPFYDSESWNKALTKSATFGMPQTLVYLAELTCKTANVAEIEKQCWPFISFAKSLAKLSQNLIPDVVLVTAGGVPLPDGQASCNAKKSPHQAALQGIGRVFRNEYPAVPCRIIDLHSTGEEILKMAPNLVTELNIGDGEDEVVLGRDRRFGLRVKRQEKYPSMQSVTETKMQLVNEGGGVRGLHWREKSRFAPKNGQVEIEVRTTGLNFRDVMYSMAALPEEALETGFAGATLGMEGAGIVTRLGNGVQNLEVGDRVIFFGASSFSSHVTTDAAAVSKIPSKLGFAAAATLPTAFFTVLYALKHLGKLKKGESILIHGAAGGVGLAAIQFAQSRGVEIFATVGSPAKRTLLQLLGVSADHIFNSRDLHFADEIMAQTEGKGVDLILNSLSGEAVSRGLEILRPFGRFIELGKRDFYENRMIGLRPFRNNISYFGVDADQLLRIDAKLARRILHQMEIMFPAGTISPLPYRTFDGENVSEAFRLMQGGGHIGKIIVTPQPLPSNRFCTIQNKVSSLNPEGLYLVLGGTKGLGLATAKKLADMGAKKLMLVSRSGSIDQTDPKVLSMITQGVRIETRVCDLTEPAALVAFLETLGEQADSIRGIIHAAVIYDDVQIAEMTREQFRRVITVKAGAALDLMNWQFRKKLDFFVSYSSMASLLGNIGQANYVAANAVLEALTQAGSEKFTSLSCLGWDAIEDTGHFSSRDDLKQAYKKTMRTEPLLSQDAMDILAKNIFSAGNESAGTTLYVTNSDWASQYICKACGVDRHSRFCLLRNVHDDRSNANGNFLDLVSGMSPKEIEEFCVDLIATQVACILSIPKEKVDADKPIVDMGMDSLTALELKIMIEKEFGFELPFMMVGSGGTVRQLAKKTVSVLANAEGTDASIIDVPAEVLYAKHESDKSNPEMLKDMVSSRH